MADQTKTDVCYLLKDWKRISPQEAPSQLYLHIKAIRECIETCEAILELVKPPRFEPAYLSLRCPFCRSGLELRLYCDEFRKCTNCPAFICIALDIDKRSYVPYAIGRLPQGYFSFGGLPFSDMHYRLNLVEAFRQARDRTMIGALTQDLETIFK